MVLKGPSNVSLQELLIVFGLKELPSSSPGVNTACSSSSDDRVKYLVSYLTWLGPILSMGSSMMSYNLSFVSEVLLLLLTVFMVEFPACTLLLDPVSLRCL